MAASELDALSDRLQSAVAVDGGKPGLSYPVSSSLRTGDAYGGAAITSSSSSSSGSVAAGRKPDGKSHSGEILGSGNWRPGHRRTGSGQIFSSGDGAASSASSATSPAATVLPAGNICPSGKIGKTGMMTRSSARSDVLRSGTGNYGHGSIMRGPGGAVTGRSSPESLPSPASFGNSVRRAMASADPEEVRRTGNEQYKRGHFGDALKLYDRAISMNPGSASCHANRAAALIATGRLAEAARECQEAVRLDPTYWRAHQRLAHLHLRFGQVEEAQKHVISSGQPLDHAEAQKLLAIERHLSRCANSRKIGDWKNALREADAAIAAGADASTLILASKAEAFLQLHRLQEADSVMSAISKLESASTLSSPTMFGMLSSAYLFIVRAQVEMAMGRFDGAMTCAERAAQLDPQSAEVAAVLSNVKSAARARTRGNELFNSGRFTEASVAYGEGLKYVRSNPVLYCNRAACWSKLGQWEKSIDDCGEALVIHPKYTKALLRRAASNAKLERWAEAIQDYEVLRNELPGDAAVNEALSHAQICLKKSSGGEDFCLKFGGRVAEVSGPQQFRAALSLPGVLVVHFASALSQQCLQISPFLDSLSAKYPSVNFLKVDVEESSEIAIAESVRVVPTFKIYRNGSRVKEMVCPSRQVLECSVRHYGL